MVLLAPCRVSHFSSFAISQHFRLRAVKNMQASRGRGAGRGGGRKGSGQPPNAAVKPGQKGAALKQGKPIAKQAQGAGEELKSSKTEDTPTVQKKFRIAALTVSTTTARDVESGDVVKVDEERGANGWLSAPCDCLLTCFAAVGEAIEAGAEQVVGLILLPLGSLLYYVSLRLAGNPADAAAEQADWSTYTLAATAGFAMIHPVYFLAVDLGGLAFIMLLVLYEVRAHGRATHRHA